ncbi:MAG: N-glycosylase/DNA lyase [Spirochaetota bacterium]|nr:N-glycosylase/DNA lyase [Spirochaetota bacterium]
MHIDEIKDVYFSIKNEIEERISEFERLWCYASDEDIFAELLFCILTPQSRATSCWLVVENLIKKDLLTKGCSQEICRELNIVRFKNRKTEYILAAREQFIQSGIIRIKSILDDFSDVFSKREYLVKNVKGFGYKEASHFLRNIGFGRDIAILDRHILKNLKNQDVIGEAPASISRKLYLNIENSMRGFALEIDIPLDHLDLLFWYIEVGKIFK